MLETLKNYIKKQQSNKVLFDDIPEKDMQLIIIIPAYNEPNLLETLVSLKACTPAQFPTEVLILINHSENALPAIVAQNKKTYAEVQNWIITASTPLLRFKCTLIGDFSAKHAGVGLARKTLMDEAVRRFIQNKNEYGTIASFDADSLVSPNYISETQKIFTYHKKLNCAHFFFEHQQNNDLSAVNKTAIILYEIYLRYFKLALKYTGFPYAYHTVGSCFAVRAATYAKQGGMSRRQAGEDFYFLHKIFPLGNCIEANNIIIYPSSRPSDRVPFGTGNAVQKIISDGDFLTYNPIYFQHLKTLFENINSLYNNDGLGIKNIYIGLPASLQTYISERDFIEKVLEINANSASEQSFKHRFYQWFDAFKVIKYLNFVHTSTVRIPVSEATVLFLTYLNRTINTKDPINLLNTLKNIELE